MEGALSKWTNVMKGWQYRWFVLDEAAGLFSYYTSREKMRKGVRRGWAHWSAFGSLTTCQTSLFHVLQIEWMKQKKSFNICTGYLLISALRSKLNIEHKHRISLFKLREITRSYCGDWRWRWLHIHDHCGQQDIPFPSQRLGGAGEVDPGSG